MTAPTIYWAGGEDCDMYSFGTGTVLTTNTGYFRSTYARCALQAISIGSNNYWQNWLPYNSTPSTFWFSCRLSAPNNISNSGGTPIMLQFVDGNNFTRLMLVSTGSALVFQKVNSAGTATTLANTLVPWTGGFVGQGIGTDQIVIQWINNASGTINLWLNGVLRYNYSGDTTTEVTSICAHRLACPNTVSQACAWSEIIVTDTDCRSWNLQTLAPVANGNTHNFDTGTPAASNVNEVALSDATLDGSTTAGQIDQYTLPSLAAGSYTILAIGVSARLQRGSSGPTKMDLGVRVSGSDYWSSDKPLDLAWNNYQNWWSADPSTSATWTGIPTNAGLKSVA